MPIYLISLDIAGSDGTVWLRWILAQLNWLRGPISRQQDLLTLFFKSNQVNSFSQVRNSFSNVMIAGAKFF